MRTRTWFLSLLAVGVAGMAWLWSASSDDEAGHGGREPVTPSNAERGPELGARGVDPEAGGDAPGRRDTRTTAPAGPQAPVAERTLRGTVVGPRGPVAGARVRISSRRNTEPAEVLTDEAGNFAYAHDEVEWVLIRVEARGLVPRESGTYFHPGQPIRIETIEGCPVRVTVRSARDGSPVAGALVEVICGDEVSYDSDFATNADPTDKGETNERGEVVLRAVHGVARVYASKRGHVRQGTRPFHVDEEGSAIELDLERGHVLTGVVLGAGDAPQAGARLRIVADPLYERHATTGADGRFRFEDLPRRGTHGAGTRAYLSARAEGRAPQAVRVELPSEGTLEPLRVQLTPARVVEGRALDKDGNPVAGVLVHLALDDMAWFNAERFGGPAAEAVSDAEGRFRLAPAAPGAATLMSWGGKNRTRVFFGDLEFTVADREAPTVVELREEHHGDRSATVTVLDPEGRPVYDALVDVEDLATDDGGFLARESTDARGRVHITGLPPSRVSFSAQKLGFASRAAVVDLTGGDAADLRIRFPSGSMRGRLVLPDGSPARSEVSLYRIPADGDADWNWPSLESAADGTFGFRGLGSDTYRIETGHLVIIGGPASFRAGARELRWVVATEEMARRLQARIRPRLASGEPIEDVRIRIDGAPEDEATCYESEDDPGVYLVPHRTPSPCTLRFDVEGYRTVRLRDVELQQGPGATEVTISLDPGIRLAGRFVSRDGRPLSDVEIRIGERETWTEEDGTFALSGLEEGKVSVGIHGDIVAPRTHEVILRADTENRLDLTLQATGAVHVRAHGAPPSETEPQFTLTPLGEGLGPTRHHALHRMWGTEDTWISHASQVAPGMYQVTLLWADKKHDLGRIEVRAAERAALEWREP